MLEVIDDEQQLPVSDVGVQTVRRGAGRPIEEADAVGDLRPHRRRIADRLEVDESRPVLVGLRFASRQLEGDRRLAHASRACEREQADLPK